MNGWTRALALTLLLFLVTPLCAKAQVSPDWKFTLLLPNEPLTTPGGEKVRPLYLFLTGNALTFVGLEPEGIEMIGIYRIAGGSVSKIVNTRTFVPGEKEWFDRISSDIMCHGEQVAFTGAIKGGSEGDGLYLSQKGKLSVIADKTTILPESKIKASSFVLESGINNFNAKHLLFTANSYGVFGLYSREKDGTLIRIADSTMTAPGTSTKFRSFNDVSLSGNRIVFSDYGNKSSHGTYLYTHGKITVLGNENTPVPGKDIPFSQLSRIAVSEKRLIAVGTYKVEDSFCVELYENTPKGWVLLLDLNTLLPPYPDFKYAPGSLMVSEDIAVFTVYLYQIITTHTSESNLFFNRNGVTKPLLKVGDILDGKIIESFLLSRFNAGCLEMLIIFKDKTSGHYSAQYLPK